MRKDNKKDSLLFEVYFSRLNYRKILEKTQKEKSENIQNQPHTSNFNLRVKQS